ncbi:MAG TPA: arylamine N-acetyltransferase [Anaerolineales bacterium]|nr:arylamine N-acetyltransferase [Anaerolineales bacterium]
MNIQAYLQRIAYSGSLEPTLDTLRTLHRAHMFAVPFENLSIHHGERIQLTPEWLFDKIVTWYRGGFCYELNGLFAELLSELGFRVERLSARVARSEGVYGPEFDHMVLLVHLDEPWLVDVGFGDSYLEPLHLRVGEEQLDPAGKFRILEAEGGLVMQEWVEDKFETQHFFTHTPYPLTAYEGMCHYHQTSPESSFTKKIVCSKITPNGRLTLSGNRFIRTREGVKEEITLEPEQIRQVLEEHFRITL